MPIEDNTQHTSSSNSQVIAAIRALEDRIVNVEGVIVARLNDIRPFDHEIMARLDDLFTGQSMMQEKIGAMENRLGVLQEQFDGFRRETNDNFRLINEKLYVLNDDVLTVRAGHRELKKRVTRLEQDQIDSAA